MKEASAAMAPCPAELPASTGRAFSPRPFPCQNQRSRCDARSRNGRCEVAFIKPPLRSRERMSIPSGPRRSGRTAPKSPTWRRRDVEAAARLEARDSLEVNGARKRRRSRPETRRRPRSSSGAEVIRPQTSCHSSPDPNPSDRDSTPGNQSVSIRPAKGGTR